MEFIREINFVVLLNKLSIFYDNQWLYTINNILSKLNLKRVWNMVLVQLSYYLTVLLKKASCLGKTI